MLVPLRLPVAERLGRFLDDAEVFGYRRPDRSTGKQYMDVGSLWIDRVHGADEFREKRSGLRAVSEDTS